MTERNKGLFRIAAIIWIVMVVVNLAVLTSMISEGYFSEMGPWPYIWVIVNFVPLTILFVYVNVSKNDYKLKSKTGSTILKVMIPLFGVLCLASLYSSQFVETRSFTTLFKIAPFGLLILQAVIFWYIPKPTKWVNPLIEKEENEALLIRKIEALREELIITSNANVEFEMKERIKKLEEQLDKLRES